MATQPQGEACVLDMRTKSRDMICVSKPSVQICVVAYSHDSSARRMGLMLNDANP